MKKLIAHVIILLIPIDPRINNKPLKYTSFGKPNPLVFKNAEAILEQLRSKISSGFHSRFKTLYMIGDNPSVDIFGAEKVINSLGIPLTKYSSSDG